VHHHPCWPAVCDQWTDDHWVMASFERFWQAMPPERLVSFPTVASLLRYLKLCLHSELVDEMRAQRARPPRPLPSRDERAPRQEHAVDAPALDRLLERELWQTVARALTPEEWLVIRLTFLAELQPREIVLGHPERFPTAHHVYRVKRRALGRLRRGSVLHVGRGGAAGGAAGGR
jgi:DNA-directed RNA polymerase specialized sigma24 family protein